MREQDLQASVNGIFVLEKIPVYGIIRAACLLANVPANGTPGYAKWCRLHILDAASETASQYTNAGAGTVASCAFTQSTWV